MKLLIFLTIPILAFIIYYFFNAPEAVKVQKSLPLDSTILQDATPLVQKDDTYIPSLAQIKTVTKERVQSHKEFLTLDDLRTVKKEPLQKEKKVVLNHHFNREVFEQLKRILQQSSSTYYAKKSIVLNSHISLLLPSLEAKEKFKNLLSSDFGLDRESIEQNFRKNRTVWDWVLFLSP